MERQKINRRAAGDLLTIGFGTSVAMWAVGYVMRNPEISAPGWLLAAALFACVLLGGFLAGRLTEGGWRAGALSGIIVAVLNLLVVGGTLGGEEGAVDTTALLWVPGTIVVTSVMMALAAMAGGRLVQTTQVDGRTHYGELERINWTGWFALVAVAATALLLLAGGLVTGSGAGLAVPDWPQVFGYNMFLYPLARMTGNIYYEHTHRLVGALVGLTTIALAVHLWIVWTRRWWAWTLGTAGVLAALLGAWLVLHQMDRSAWVPFVWLGASVVMALALAGPAAVRRNVWPWLAALAVVAVSTQGVMGGYRVSQAAAAATGTGVEVATAEHETPLSVVLRVAHGVFGQLFFALMVVLAVGASKMWTRAKGAVEAMAPSTDRALAVALVVGLVVQLVLGALIRHVQMPPMLHIVMAAVLLLLAIAVGVRAWGLHGRHERKIKWLGIAMVVLVITQVMLGFSALIVTGLWTVMDSIPMTRVLFTTAHQINGAALLAVATAMMLLNYRVLREADPWVIERSAGHSVPLAK